MTESKKILSSPEEIELRAEMYFADCLNRGAAFTMSGLAYALGFTNTSSMVRYRKAEGYEEFHDAMNRVCLRIEQFTEEQLYNKGVNVAGPIFALKARQGLTDKQEGEGNTVVVKIDPGSAKLV